MGRLILGTLPAKSGVLAAWLLLLSAACDGRVRAATYQVGASQPYRGIGNLPALAPGDVVDIHPGTYAEVKRWTQAGTAGSPILIRGVGATRPVFDAAGQSVDGVLPRPRAAFQIEAGCITIEHIEFKNARNGNNGAGIRVTGASNVTIRDCRITQCDMGIMSDNNRDLVIESSEIAFNGTASHDGYSHNLYLGGDNSRVQFCHIHDAPNGQNFKSRAHYTELICNYIADSQDGEVGLVDSSATAKPDSHAVMIGNIVISKPRRSGYNSMRFIQFGQDMRGQHNGTLFAFNNTFVAGDARILFLSANTTNATVVAHNNIFYGSGKIVDTLAGKVGGSNNWVHSTAPVPDGFTETIKGNDPGFINAAARRFGLTAGSQCRDQGLGVLEFMDGAGNPRPGLPLFEYVTHMRNRERPRQGRADIGACEHNPSEAADPR